MFCLSLCECFHSLSLPFPSLEDLRAEFDDFQENSRDLEAELETSLEQTEAKNRDLLAKVQRLQDENDQMKVITLNI